MKNTLLDEDQLKDLQSLNTEDEDIVSELIDIFLDQSPPILEQIKSAIQGSDFIQIESLAHKLKGSCSNLGAKSLSLLCQDLEDRGKEKSSEDIENIRLKIESTYQEVKTELLDKWHS